MGKSSVNCLVFHMLSSRWCVNTIQPCQYEQISKLLVHWSLHFPPLVSGNRNYFCLEVSKPERTSVCSLSSSLLALLENCPYETVNLSPFVTWNRHPAQVLFWMEIYFPLSSILKTSVVHSYDQNWQVCMSKGNASVVWCDMNSVQTFSYGFYFCWCNKGIFYYLSGSEDGS